jgi:hypothetical protein
MGGNVDVETLDTLAFARSDTTRLLILGPRDPTPSDWAAWVQAYTRSAVEHDVRSLLVVSEGGGPNANQRRELMEDLARGLGPDVGDSFKTAICTDAPSARFITAALGWLYAMQGMKVLGYRQRRDGLLYLGVEESRHPAIFNTISSLQTELQHRS